MPNHGRSESRTARATLVALELITDVSVAVRRYIQLPYGFSYSFDKTVDWLVALQKPLSCAGFRIEDHLAVACWPSIRGPVFDERRRQIDPIGKECSRIAEFIDEMGAPREVLFKGSLDSVALSIEELELWARSYNFSLAVWDVTFPDHPSATETRTTIRMIPLELGSRSGGVAMSVSDEEDQ